MRRNIFIIVCAAIVAIAIGSYIFYSGNINLQDISSFAADNNQNASASIVPFIEIAHGSQSAVERRVNYIITSPDQFNELWNMIGVTGVPPKVDFEKDAVIAVFAGRKPATGYSIAIAKIEDTDLRTVSITLANPDEKCVPAKSITTPYQLITVPTTSLPLSHKDIVVTTNCL